MIRKKRRPGAPHSKERCDRQNRDAPNLMTSRELLSGKSGAWGRRTPKNTAMARIATRRI
jgi:hypothetical protein